MAVGESLDVAESDVALASVVVCEGLPGGDVGGGYVLGGEPLGAEALPAAVGGTGESVRAHGAGADVAVAGECVEALAFACSSVAGDVLALVVDADVPGGASAPGSAAYADVSVGPEARAVVGCAYDSADVADEAGDARPGVGGGAALRVGAGDESAEPLVLRAASAGDVRGDAVEGDGGGGSAVGEASPDS